MTTGAETAWLRSSAGTRVPDFYAEIGVTVPDRGGEEAPVRCFANPQGHSHDDKNASCSVNLLTGLWKCHGCGTSGNAYQAALALGYQEKRALDLARSYGLFMETGREKAKMPAERQLKKWREQLIGKSPYSDKGWNRLTRRLFELKGWTPAALFRCGVGWDGERLTFPIRNERLKCVGLVRYLPGGSPKSKALPGSKRLLFPAPEVLSRDRPLFIVEGEGDAVAVRSCGHQATAVPGVGNWRLEFVPRLAKFKRIVILADADAQGRDLGYRIKGAIPRARLVDVAPGCEDGRDIGDLVAEAAHDGGVEQMGLWLEGLAR